MPHHRVYGGAEDAGLSDSNEAAKKKKGHNALRDVAR
jgi:hypothetical protein